MRKGTFDWSLQLANPRCKCLVYYCPSLEVKVFHWKEFHKPNIDIIIIFFFIITIPFITQKMDGVHNSICDCITQLHNQLDVHSIWNKNILMKTSPIPIECLHGIRNTQGCNHRFTESVALPSQRTTSRKLLWLVYLQHQQPSHLHHSIPCEKSEIEGTCHSYSIHTPPSDFTCWKTSHSNDCRFSYWRRHLHNWSIMLSSRWVYQSLPLWCTSLRGVLQRPFFYLRLT